MTTMAQSPVIDITTPTPVLEHRLDELLRREGNLYDCGTTCALKDLPDGNCLACPVSMAEAEVIPGMSYEDASKRLLCRVGREQQVVAMTLIAQRHGERRE